MTYAAAPGTIEITSSIDAHQFEIYTLFFDNSMLTDATARDRDIATKTAMFNRAPQNMKILAEGAKLPARGAKPGIRLHRGLGH